MKFSGKIGFWVEDIEIKPGVFKPNIIEKSYFGDILRNNRRFQTAQNQQNENLVVNNQISIISDLYIQQNWSSIKYVLWNGVRWKVSSIDIGSYPRIVLELGGVYNGTIISA